MTTQVAATFVGGVFKPDQDLALPEQARVTLTIEPLAIENKAAAAWQALKANLKAHPIRGTGPRYTRDELHERR